MFTKEVVTTSLLTAVLVVTLMVAKEKFLDKSGS